jgi:hypothetical protein
MSPDAAWCDPRLFEKCGPALAVSPGAAVPQKDGGGLANMRTLEAYDDALLYLAIAGPYDEFVAVVKGGCSTVGDVVSLVGRAICRSRELLP